MNNYAIVDQNGNIINIVLWDGELGWCPPEGCIAVQSDIAMVGGTYLDSVFSSPLQVQALAELIKSDVVMNRISEAVCLGLNSWTGEDVVAFVNYRRELRDFVDGTTTGPLPTQPSYPVGT
jgi:hypothetical protein